MKAFILAAGFGTRLQEAFPDLPKCLVPIHGVPLIHWVMKSLIAAGVTECVVNTHYRAEQVEHYLTTARSQLPLLIKTIHEPEILGTGGAIKNVAAQLSGEEDFFVHNADVLSTFDLSKLWHQHIEQKNIATLLVRAGESNKRSLVFRKADSQLVGEGSAGEGATFSAGFCGIQVINKKLIDLMAPDGRIFSQITTYQREAKQGSRILACPLAGAGWWDVGTPERVINAEKEFLGFAGN